MAHKIKEVREMLDKIAIEKATYQLNERVENKRIINKEREMTHSFVIPSDIIGREEDKEEIIRLVLDQPNDDENLSVVPIVGIGGLGKTALAKLIYNDYRINEQFPLRIWVCVGQDFDVKKLVASIIKSAASNGVPRPGESYKDLDMQQLQIVLREKIGGKKYFLVLDDVWNDDRTKWGELKDLLSVGAHGSKIMVTTRSNKVATIMGAAQPCELSVLPHDMCMSLFVRYAFEKGQEKMYPNLLKIGDDIVKKCQGVPLAVRTVGSQLFSKTDYREWELVRDNQIWKMEQKEDDILPALKLSYEHLPSHLKRCFAYCSNFSKDYEFKDFELVLFWMAHGLLQCSKESEDLEDVGMRYLNDLASRSFFQDIEYDGYWVQYKIHDLLHDLTLSVTQNECTTVTSSSSSIPQNVRHLSFVELSSLSQEIHVLLNNFDRIRTISMRNAVEGTNLKSILEKSFLRFKYLRLLDFSNSQFYELPSSISTLKHLRYLNLAANRKIKRLPDDICNLHNLETLILGGCVELEELPKDIRYMVSLRFLWITTKQKYLPKDGIGSLKSLRTLVISESENIECMFEDMQGLKSLRTLMIGGCENLNSLPQSIKYLPALETLVIDHCENLDLSMEDGKDDHDLNHFSLRKLLIESLPKLVELPQWLFQGSVNTLQFIRIQDCSKIAKLPDCFGILTSLRELHVFSCDELEERIEGEDWPKISHVPKIEVNGINIKATNN